MQCLLLFLYLQIFLLSPGTSLLVGCTNGQVLSLHWRELVVSVEEGEGRRMTLPLPLVVSLWPLCDGVAVHHLASWWKWVVVSKGPRIVALSLADWLQPNDQPRDSPPPHIWVSDGHTMPVSGQILQHQPPPTIYGILALCYRPLQPT